MSDPTPADVEAGTRALLAMGGLPTPAQMAEVVLAAVLVDRDARVRADGAQAMLDWLAVRGQSAMPGWLLEAAEAEIGEVVTQPATVQVAAAVRAKVAEQIARDIERAELHRALELGESGGPVSDHDRGTQHGASAAAARHAAIARQHATGSPS